MNEQCPICGRPRNVFNDAGRGSESDVRFYDCIHCHVVEWEILEASE